MDIETHGKQIGIGGASRQHVVDRSNDRVSKYGDRGRQFMELSDLITTKAVFSGVKVATKKQALQELAERAASLTGLEDREIFETLMGRERLGTTGVGQGVAIPHGRLNRLDSLFVLFARLGKPIDFDSIDDQPVDLVFMLLAPEGAGADHLKALAKIARLLRNRSMCEKLRGCDSEDALFAVLTDATAQDHAA